MKKISLVILTLLLVACARKRDDIINVAADDPEMNAAIQQAQRTLPEFWQRRERDGKNFTGLLKVYFVDQDSTGGEHMWVRVKQHGPTEVTGVLMDEPGWLKSVKSGDQVRFPPARISDWLYIENRKARGAFTVQLLRKRMTPEERRKHDEGYPFTYD